MTEVMMWLR
jgi:hypothetical protein